MAPVAGEDFENAAGALGAACVENVHHELAVGGRGAGPVRRLHLPVVVLAGSDVTVADVDAPALCQVAGAVHPSSLVVSMQYA